jgi:nicotinamidase-related amidase
MATTSKDLYGSAPDKSRTAVLIIDMINDLQFPEANALMEFAVPMAKRIDALAKRARTAGVPVIFVNDNFGRWRSDFKALVKHCLASRGKTIARLLQPKAKDYFVLKPKHSAFHSTTLDLLLKHLGTRKLIITGMASNICVLFTANDAYMRDFELFVPSDCVCANTEPENDHALEQIKKLLKADVRNSLKITLAKKNRLDRSIFRRHRK